MIDCSGVWYNYINMRVYLDNCCYNRPFDDQGQLRVRLETEAKLEIQDQMRTGILEYAWSDILSSECLRGPSADRIFTMFPWEERATVNVEITDDIIVDAERLMRLGLKSADALHIACAVAADCDWFFTVDKGILKKISKVGEMRVANPVEYLL